MAEQLAKGAYFAGYSSTNVDPAGVVTRPANGTLTPAPVINGKTYNVVTVVTPDPDPKKPDNVSVQVTY